MPECVVCGKTLEEQVMEAQVEHDGEQFYVCCPTCESEFESDPGQYA